MASDRIAVALIMALAEAARGHKFSPDEMARISSEIAQSGQDYYPPDAPPEEDAEALAEFFVDGWDLDTLYDFAVEKLAEDFRRSPETYREYREAFDYHNREPDVTAD